jgi:Uncharacterised nucleotidyltransferase
MSTEIHWLIDCWRALARHEAPPVPIDSLDWNGVVETAEGESLAAALGFACKSAPPERTPPAVRERLRRHLVEGTARHLVLSGELARLLKSFAREGIAVIPLKGPALAEALYPDPAIRPCSDLDLLIRREHLERVDELLQRLAYRRVADAHSFRFDVAYDHATLYASPSGVHVDLHWSLLSEPRYAWNEREGQTVWDRAVRMPVAGEEALGLCPEDLLLYLSVHLAVHHSLAGLLWYYDLFLLLGRWAETLDWQAVSARASRWRVRSAVYFALREIETVFGVRAPAALMKDLEPRGPRAAAMAWLLRHRGPAQRRAAEHLIGLLLVDRGRDLVGTLGRIVLPPSDWMAARYDGAGASRLRHYAAHYRRLGHVVAQATAGLRRRRR